MRFSTRSSVCCAAYPSIRCLAAARRDCSLPMQRTGREAITVEFGGPRVYSYEELLRTIARAANVKPILVPLPLAIWHALAGVAEMLPGAPLTRTQVELMQIDCVVSADVAGSAELGILPRAMEEVLQSILSRA